MIDPLRRTGRTTRMLKEAIAELGQCEQVYIWCNTNRDAFIYYGMMVRILFDTGIMCDYRNRLELKILNTTYKFVVRWRFKYLDNNPPFVKNFVDHHIYGDFLL